jgi:hypothetical protein
MNVAKTITLIGATALSACASYMLPVPGDFTPAVTLPVQGATGFKLKQMTVGDYQVSIDRGSTNERNQGSGAVTAARKRQNYSVVIQRAGSTVFTGGCQLVASETSVGAPAGIQITASEKAELDCELLPNGTGSKSWRLQLNGDPDAPLNGSFTGDGSFVLQGVGSAIGSMKHGPTVGYYIKRDDRTVASVQTSGKRQVLFAPDAQSDALVAAAVVLLLIDESVRDLD